MARRKWTLLVFLVCACSFVYSRPSQESFSSVTFTTTTEIPYRYNNNNSTSNENINISFKNFNVTDSLGNLVLSNVIQRQSRKRRLNSNSNKVKNNDKQNWQKKNQNSFKPDSITTPIRAQNINSNENQSSKKVTIRKVITKWKDKVDVNDIDFDSSFSTEQGKDAIAFHGSTESYSAEDNLLDASTEDPDISLKVKNKIYTTFNNNKVFRPYNDYTEEMQVYSSNIHMVDRFSTKRPLYTFNTPTPTPIITNVGTPQAWAGQNTHHQSHPIRRKTTTIKPIKITSATPQHVMYDYHNNIHSYQHEYEPDHNTFEVSTFQPVNAHTDRIVIRPEEYSASPDDCPTIYLTLNNTFQGQGKEACPDLNIAVNTNVINKNVVVESEEEEDGEDSLFPAGFGIPFVEDSSSEESLVTNGISSDESEEPESASVESNAYANYNVAPASQGESQAIPAAVAPAANSPNGALTSLHNAIHKDDDDFFSALISFLRPAFNILGWVATVNPLNLGLFSLLMTPIALAIAGTSGVTALFAPWAIPYGREAPKIVHVYRPQWKWDDENKTWHLNSFPHNRRYYRRPKNSNEVMDNNNSTIKSTWFYKLKQFLKATTLNLRTMKKNKREGESRKYKRKKRETWTRRIK